MTPHGLNYLELCKAILSQVTPSLAAPLRKANTKECGVQVNAKVEKIVQCSLGPKTLLCLDSDNPSSVKSPKSPDVAKQAPHMMPPVSNLRFPRPVSIYSPVFDRRIQLKKLSEDGVGNGEADEAEHAESDKEADNELSGEDTDKDVKTTFHRSYKGSNFQVGFCVEKPREE